MNIDFYGAFLYPRTYHLNRMRLYKLLTLKSTGFSPVCLFSRSHTTAVSLTVCVSLPSSLISFDTLCIFIFFNCITKPSVHEIMMAVHSFAFYSASHIFAKAEMSFFFLFSFKLTKVGKSIQWKWWWWWRRRSKRKRFILSFMSARL